MKKTRIAVGTPAPMQKANKGLTVIRARKRVSDGYEACLDVHTPGGLFEGTNGNRYIVTHDHDTTIAVALIHRDLKSFTWQPLGLAPLDYGRWYGAYSLHLTHVLPDIKGPLTPGFIGIADRYAQIDCLDLTGKVGCVDLGDVGQTAFGMADFDGWAVRPTGGGPTFFERSPPGHTKLTLYPTSTQGG